MSTAPRPNTHHIAIGFCILGLGLVLILDRLGVMPAETTLRYWPLALVVVGLSVIVQACRPDAPVVRSTVPWGSIVWILILGFSLSHVFERRGEAASASDPTQAIFAVLSGADHTADSGFRAGRITAVMGGAKLDLRHARPGPGEDVVVDVFTLMGGSVLLAPPDWRLDVRAATVMGGIDDQRQRPERRRGRRDAEDEDAWRNGWEQPGSTTAPSAAEPGAEMPIEAADPGSATSSSADGTSAAAPRLVVRGFVGLGGLAIKAR